MNFDQEPLLQFIPSRRAFRRAGVSVGAHSGAGTRCVVEQRAEDGCKEGPEGRKMAPKKAEGSGYPAASRWHPDGHMCLAERRPQDGQDGLRWLQDGLKLAPRWPKMAPRAQRWPKMDPREAQEGSQEGPKSVFQGFPTSKPKKGVCPSI